MNDFSRAPRVLVVEDDEDIAQALQRSLRMEGYEVRAAADGPGALEHGRSFAPDLVILDLGLPGLDGLEVARSLRADDDVPILILTARDALESRVEGLDAGADDYLVKPFERQELLARMRALLRRRPPRGAGMSTHCPAPTLVLASARLAPTLLGSRLRCRADQGKFRFSFAPRRGTQGKGLALRRSVEPQNAGPQQSTPGAGPRPNSSGRTSPDDRSQLSATLARRREGCLLCRRGR